MENRKIFFKLTYKVTLILLIISFLIIFNSIYVIAETGDQELEKVQEQEKEEVKKNPTLEECIAKLTKKFIKDESISLQEDFFLIGEESGYLKGISNRNKEELITKEMISRIICNVLNIDPIYSKDPLFEDIKGHSNEEYIKAAYAEYLIDSTDENKFEPEWNITQGELADIINNIEDYLIDPNRFKLKMKSESTLNKEEKIKKLLSMCTYKNYMEKITVGTQIGVLEKSESQSYINGYFIPSFTLKGDTVIAVADLKYYGFHVNWNEENKKISINRSENKAVLGIDSEEVKNREERFIGRPMVYTNLSVYVGNRKLPCYSIDNSTMIYFNDLVVFGDLRWDGDQKEAALYLKNLEYNDGMNVELVDSMILNHHASTIDVDVVHVWYDEKSKEAGVEEDSFYGIPAKGYEKYGLEKYSSYEKKIYLGTIIKRTNVLENPFYEEELKYIQSEKMIQYVTSLLRDSDEYLFSLVKPSLIIATMKWAAGGFEKGEKVEILYGEAGYWYECKSVDTGKKGRIPWGSASIPKDPPTNKNQMTKEQLESYVNKKGFTSSTNYFVWTDLDRQMTHVFQKDNGEWKVLRSMLCSTGKNITPTPRGLFTIKERGAYFGDGYMCKNWVQIWGDYLYHSVLMDVTGTYILENNVLGKRASQGCMRFSLENSKWFYDIIPRNTTVWIN